MHQNTSWKSFLLKHIFNWRLLKDFFTSLLFLEVFQHTQELCVSGFLETLGHSVIYNCHLRLIIDWLYIQIMLSSATDLCYRWHCSRNLSVKGGKGGVSGRKKQEDLKLRFRNTERALSAPRRQVDSRLLVWTWQYLGVMQIPPGNVATAETWAHTWEKKLARRSPHHFSPSKCSFPGKSEPHAMSVWNTFLNKQEEI